jgi:hypothetical protein
VTGMVNASKIVAATLAAIAATVVLAVLLAAFALYALGDPPPSDRDFDVLSDDVAVLESTHPDIAGTALSLDRDDLSYEVAVEVRPDAAPGAVLAVVHDTMGVVVAGGHSLTGTFSVAIGSPSGRPVPTFTVHDIVHGYVTDVDAEAAAWVERTARFPGDVTLHAAASSYSRSYEVRGDVPPAPEEFSAAVATLAGPPRSTAQPARWRMVYGDPARPAAEFDTTPDEPPSGTTEVMRALVEATAGPDTRRLTVEVADRDSSEPERLDVHVEAEPGHDGRRLEAACRAALDASGVPYELIAD